MKSFPLNTPNYIGLDYETTGLPNGVHFRQLNGKINVINPLENDHPFRDVSATQFGFWDADTGKTTHLQIDFSNPDVHSRFIKGSEHKRLITDPFTGKKITVDAYHIRQTDPADILKLVSNSKVKGKKAEALSQPFIRKALGSRETVFILGDKQVTGMPLSHLAAAGSVEDKIKAGYPLMNLKNVSQREFAGKGSKLLI